MIETDPHEAEAAKRAGGIVLFADDFGTATGWREDDGTYVLEWSFDSEKAWAVVTRDELRTVIARLQELESRA